MMPVMEEVLLRFPHLGLQIFKTLDNSSLAKCRKVARSWSSFINYEELPWKRILQEYPCKDPQTKLLVSLITGQNDMFQAIFEAEKDNLKLKNDYEDVPSKLARKIRDLTYPNHVGLSAIIDSVTPYHLAAAIGNFSACELIINSVGEKNPESCFDGMTPLHFAAKNGHFDICKLIVCQIDDKNPKDNILDLTPLHYAARRGHFSVCKFLIEIIKEKNPFDFDRDTPLHEAARNGHLSICKLITEYVKEKHPKNDFGRTPLQLAQINGHSLVTQFFSSLP